MTPLPEGTTMLSMLLEMKSIKGASVSLINTTYGHEWLCWFECETTYDGMKKKFDFRTSHASPSIAVSLVYNEVQKASIEGLGELKPSLLGYTVKEILDDPNGPNYQPEVFNDPRGQTDEVPF